MGTGIVVVDRRRFGLAGVGETVIIEHCVFLADLLKARSSQRAVRFYIAP